MRMTEIKETEHFKKREILYSKTAEENNIDNTPKDTKVIENINYTLQRLEKIREGYGHPIYINSGYRCDELNELVGGVKNSYHKTGLAVDIRWDYDLIVYILEHHSFDKLIREKSKNGMWLHLQFKRDEKEERRKVLYLEV